MPRKPGEHYNLSLMLTRKQESALKEAAGVTSIADYVRSLLAQHVPDFPCDVPKRGTGHYQAGSAKLNQQFGYLGGIVFVRSGSDTGYYLRQVGEPDKWLGKTSVSARKALRAIDRS